mmetsp:Transcript_128416/g.236218  ORF Transcript_128416/g.236218 Transcript_128416/m.236218 type:complete len:139 (-) Transcript_128416:18-434(-)
MALDNPCTVGHGDLQMRGAEAGMAAIGHGRFSFRIQRAHVAVQIQSMGDLRAATGNRHALRRPATSCRCGVAVRLAIPGSNSVLGCFTSRRSATIRWGDFTPVLIGCLRDAAWTGLRLQSITQITLRRSIFAQVGPVG